MENQWNPLPKVGLITALIIAVSFWIYALTDDDGFLFLDYVNLPFHEFGHILFGIFGDTLGIWGGTIMQLLIPFGILMSFCRKKETIGTAFSAFWFGENFLNISVYMADARKMELPLVGSGDHDWNIILSELSMLQYDATIAGFIKALGWLIMVSSLLWLTIISLRK